MKEGAVLLIVLCAVPPPFVLINWICIPAVNGERGESRFLFTAPFVLYFLACRFQLERGAISNPKSHNGTRNYFSLLLTPKLFASWFLRARARGSDVVRFNTRLSSVWILEIKARSINRSLHKQQIYYFKIPELTFKKLTSIQQGIKRPISTACAQLD